MPDLWLPGATRVPGNNGLAAGAGGGKGLRFHTWHTFEGIPADYSYSPDCVQAAKYLNSQGSTSTFVLNIKTGAIAQLLPANQAARTLRAAAGYPNDVNRYGEIHMQTEVLANARRPFTLDLTPDGRRGLTTLVNFLRSWGIPDQWAWPYGPPVYPGAGVRRVLPMRSGHAYHAGWPYNDHGDPGAIAAPWSLSGGQPAAGITVKAGSRWQVTADALNARLSPDGDVIGAAPKGTVITATGKTSGLWMEGQTPYQQQQNMRAWYHSDHLKEYVVPTPTPTPAPKPEPVPDLPPVHRIAGANRYEVFTNASTYRLPDGPGLLLAADGTADLQAAVLMAARRPDVDLQLTDARGNLRGVTLTHITNTRPAWILPVGGPGTIPDATVRAAMTAAGIK